MAFSPQQVDHYRQLAQKQMATPLIFGVYNFPDGRVAQLGTYYKDLCRHSHLVGMSGVGKSTMIGNLITQSMMSGVGVFVIEPHNDLVADALARCPADRENDVCVVNPVARPAPATPMPQDKAGKTLWNLQRIIADRAPGINILEATNPADIQGVVSNGMSLFRKVMGASWDTSVRMRRIMQMGLNSLLYWRGDAMLDDFYQFLINEDFRNEVNNAKNGRGRNRYASQFWLQEFENWSKSDKTGAMQPPITRVQAFLSDSRVANIVNQRHTTIDFWDLMMNNKIVLAPISQELGDDVMQFLGTLLVVKMRSAGVSRAHLPDDARSPFMIYIDECQNFIMPDLIQALAEDRKRGLGYFFAHQMAAQMRTGGVSKGGADMLDALMGNVGTRIVFQVGIEDGPYFAKGLKNIASSDIVSLERFNAYASFLVDAGAQDIASLQTVDKPPVNNEMLAINLADPRPEMRLDNNDLKLLNQVEALPTLDERVTRLKELSEDDWERFKVARRYRDAKLLQNLSRYPEQVPDKSERILIKSTLKYDTPVYEIEAEVERSLALTVTAGGGDEGWSEGGGEYDW